MDRLVVHPEIEAALQSGDAVVALESAVITSGLPRTPLTLPAGIDVQAWNSSQPVNLELARAMEQMVRISGAVPATVAVIDGFLRIGLADDDLIRLASEPCAAKASSSDLAYVMANGGSAGTTVSGALAACRSARTLLPHAAALRVLATGGIGGVHRNWQQVPDLSADLRAIARTPMCVVCSGAKSVLDLPATLEALETLGVPVVGYRTSCFPCFLCAGDDQLRLDKRLDDLRATAKLCALHWSMSGGGIVLANPPPLEFAMERDWLDQAVNDAEQLASSRGISGAMRTPFLLENIARLTQGRSLQANLALLLGNAHLARELAVVMNTTAKPR